MNITAQRNNYTRIYKQESNGYSVLIAINQQINTAGISYLKYLKRLPMGDGTTYFSLNSYAWLRKVYIDSIVVLRLFVCGWAIIRDIRHYAYNPTLHTDFTLDIYWIIWMVFWINRIL